MKEKLMARVFIGIEDDHLKDSVFHVRFKTPMNQGGRTVVVLPRLDGGTVKTAGPMKSAGLIEGR